MTEIYFDNGATTRAFPEVRQIMDEMLEKVTVIPLPCTGRASRQNNI